MISRGSKQTSKLRLGNSVRFGSIRHRVMTTDPPRYRRHVPTRGPVSGSAISRVRAQGPGNPETSPSRKLHVAIARGRPFRFKQTATRTSRDATPLLPSPTPGDRHVESSRRGKKKLEGKESDTTAARHVELPHRRKGNPTRPRSATWRRGGGGGAPRPG
ncbi:hypothetical protein NL676_030283 [Syzygium grande]|nr:hypothetical protein NL676_030283 [Syzygium grande]